MPAYYLQFINLLTAFTSKYRSISDVVLSADYVADSVQLLTTVQPV